MSGREIEVSDTQVYMSKELIKFGVYDSGITEVRLLRAVEGGTTAHGGTLRLKGIGIWALRCEGAVGARL